MKGRGARSRRRGRAAIWALAPTRPRRPRRPTKPARKLPSALVPAQPGGRGVRRRYRYSGPAGTRAYEVYVPNGLRTAPVPVLMLLHGCGQRAVDLAAVTRFNLIADRNRFVVVYPEQAAGHHPQRCWRWFAGSHHDRGAGEPAVLAGIVERVLSERSRWRADPDRVYVAGMSAGGAMALTLGAAYPDLFAAVAAHSAPPNGSAGERTQVADAMAGRRAGPDRTALDGRPFPPTMLVQGLFDHTVRPACVDRFVEQWLASRASAAMEPRHRIARVTSAVRPARGRTRGHTLRRWYDARGRKELEVWTVAGLGHAWSGGLPDRPFSDPRGPRASTAIWDFLSAHRRRS